MEKKGDGGVTRKEIKGKGENDCVVLFRVSMVG